MKKTIYILLFALLVISGIVFANREIKMDSAIISQPKPLSATESAAALKNWEASPDGIAYKAWEVSPVGKKVHASAAKIRKSISQYTQMQGEVTSLSLPPGSRLGFGIMVKIEGEDFILAFGPETPEKNTLNFNPKFAKLHQLQVNDKIIIKSRNVSFAPKYAYPIIYGDRVEQNHKLIYQRIANPNDGC